MKFYAVEKKLFGLADNYLADVRLDVRFKRTLKRLAAVMFKYDISTANLTTLKKIVDFLDKIE